MPGVLLLERDAYVASSLPRMMRAKRTADLSLGIAVTGMDEKQPERNVVFESPQRNRCLEARVVLEAAGIAPATEYEDGHWQLVVIANDVPTAIHELDAYRREQEHDVPKKRRRIPVFFGAGLGVLAYVAIMVAVGVVSSTENSQPLWRAAGRMHAGDALSGELYRAVTALTLHVDLGHLISNLAFGSVFGFLVGRILGGGIGWLTIVSAGAIGNLMNAMAQAPDHASIGASTAVFAALGVMVAHAMRPAEDIQERRLQRWSPLIGGLIMLGMTGTGDERTDVGAHFAGFIAGLAMGWFACRLPEKSLANPSVQIAAGAATVVIVIAAWCFAIAGAQ